MWDGNGTIRGITGSRSIRRTTRSCTRPHTRRALALDERRLDLDAVRAPRSAIAVDPNNANHAYVVYSGYTINTPSQPGHVFSVTYDPAGPSTTWTSLDNNIGDLPANSVAYDAVKDDLYVSSDFGVMKLPHASTSWTMAGTGLPVVQVPDLKIMPGVRRLYAATHGMSLWSMPLPG
jgi:hypothetical protein